MPKKRKLIFIADDDAQFLQSLETAFHDDPIFALRSFPSGEELVQHMAFGPDVIVLNYDRNGLEALRYSKELSPAIPVIMLSSLEDLNAANRCEQNRAFDFIVKSPLVFFRLRKALSTLLMLEHSFSREIQ